MNPESKELSELSKRFIQVIDKSGYSSYRIAKEIDGISQPVITHIRKGRNEPGLKAIIALLNHFPQINPLWLLTGKGAITMNTEANAQLTTDGLYDPFVEELKKALHDKDKTIALQREKIAALEQHKNKFLKVYKQDLEHKAKLSQIAEMFYDHMRGSQMESTMVFDIVSEVLKNRN